MAALATNMAGTIAQADPRNLDPAEAKNKTLMTWLVDYHDRRISSQYVIINADKSPDGTYFGRIGNFQGRDIQKMRAVDTSAVRFKRLLDKELLVDHVAIMPVVGYSGIAGLMIGAAYGTHGNEISIGYGDIGFVGGEVGMSYIRSAAENYLVFIFTLDRA